MTSWIGDERSSGASAVAGCAGGSAGGMNERRRRRAAAAAAQRAVSATRPATRSSQPLNSVKTQHSHARPQREQTTDCGSDGMVQMDDADECERREAAEPFCAPLGSAQPPLHAHPSTMLEDQRIPEASQLARLLMPAIGPRLMGESERCSREPADVASRRAAWTARDPNRKAMSSSDCRSQNH